MEGKSEKKGGDNVKIDKKNFWSRLKLIFDAWKKGGAPFGGKDPVDALLVYQGPDADDVVYSRSQSVALYLFGYELQDTIVVFTLPGTLYVLTSQKKAALLGEVGESDGELKLRAMEKNKADKYAANFDTLVKAIKASSKGKRIGHIKKDTPKGPFVTAFMEALKTNDITLEDTTYGLGIPLFNHDPSAVKCVKMAAAHTTAVLKQHLLPAIETAIEEEKKVTHSKLAEDTDEMLSNPKKLDPNSKLDSENMESCYTPIVMSGGKYDLKPSAQSNDDPLDYGTVIVQLGARYKSFCTNIGRTYFINPTPDQKEVYALLVAIYQAAFAVMKPGKKLAGVMETAERVIKAKRPDLANNFRKDCGFGMGFEFRFSELVLSNKNQLLFKAGQVFNFCIGFENLLTGGKDAKEGERKKYAVLLADTILLNEQEAETLTPMPRKFDEVSYSIGGPEPEPAKPMEVEDGKRGRATRSARAAEGKIDVMEEEKLRRHQEELNRKKNEEALRRIVEGDFNKNFSKEHKLGKFESYPDVSNFPAGARPDTITVDTQAETVLCPIHKQLVPFHIGTIKSVHKSEEADGSILLRIAFNVPGTSQAAIQALPTFADKQKKFIRELTYKAYKAGGNALNKAFFEIQELRKRVTNRLKESAAKRDLVEQEELKTRAAGPYMKLKDLQMKPQTGGRKTTGHLEAHSNGFRFIAAQKFKIDVIYKNIKHAFFQPAEKTTTNVTIHLELHHPIMLGKKARTKKTNFLQFFVEVIETSQDLDRAHRHMDEDGLQEEAEERRNRMRWNERFREFVKKVESALRNDAPELKFEFDIPYRELAFSGVPFKNTCDVMPTVHALVALEETPPMCVTLDEVEVAVFERVNFNLRNFDLVFVYKDFRKPVQQISAIPSKSFEQIKKWLDSCNIVYFETPVNLAWKKLLKDIGSSQESLQEFYEQGGWEQLVKDGANESMEDDGGDAGGDDAAGGESKADDGAGAVNGAGGGGGGRGKKKPVAEDDESDYSGGSADEGSSDDEISDEDEDVDEDEADEDGEGGSDDEGGGGGGGSEDEEGADWDELEAKAKESDARKRKREEEDGEQQRKKQKTQKAAVPKPHIRK